MFNPAITFVIQQQGRPPRRETVRRSVIRFGRDNRGHVHLDDPAVAKRHAVLEIAGRDRMTLITLAGESGVRLNGEWIDESSVREGDRIQIGATEILIEEVVYEASELSQADGDVGLMTAPSPQGGRGIDTRVGSSPAPGRKRPEIDEPLITFVTDAPLATSASPALRSFVAPRSSHGYAMIAQGPALRSDEVEMPHLVVAEVQVCWGDNVLFVTHLDASQTFHVGDEQKPGAPCDFLVPREKLGAARLPLVLGESATLWLVIPAQARGHLEAIDGSRSPLDAVRASSEPCADAPEAKKLALSLGMRARLEFGDIVIHVAAVRAGKPMPHGLVSGWDASALAYLGLSALSVGGLLSSMAMLVPPLGMLNDDETDSDRLYLLQQYLSSAAEREQRALQGDAPLDTPKSSAAGAQASGDEGAMGKPDEAKERGHYAIQGSAHPSERQLSRHDAVREAEPFEGVIGLLNSQLLGDPNVPTAPWGADLAVGSDPRSAQGDMWSAEIGNANGPGGLGISGTGIGGGHRNEGIGIGDIGTIGSIGRDEAGMGLDIGRPSSSHRTRVPRLRSSDTTVSGRLPAEVVRRIVRQNHPRFRHCYEKGLLKNPSLEGRVSVRFVIGRDGAVTNVADGGSDLPDPTVVRCVSSAFYDIGFPKPEGGIVTVVYPIALQPD